jgi:hypothetical protein
MQVRMFARPSTCKQTCPVGPLYGFVGWGEKSAGPTLGFTMILSQATWK